jgi:D-tyrosyl-tRNA(Tyr) deacylase
VTVDGERVAEVGNGLLILLGVAAGDTREDAEYLAEKIAHLRIFSDDDDKMNRSLMEQHGSALVVSQFTLLADCRKGRRPSFAAAAAPDVAELLYLVFAKKMQDCGVQVQTGRFGAMMQVELVNDGPVTLLLDQGV